MLTFTNAVATFDLSDLDCQEGPFYLCVKLSKNSAADKDFVLEGDGSATKYVQCTNSLVNCAGKSLSLYIYMPIYQHNLSHTKYCTQFLFFQARF